MSFVKNLHFPQASKKGGIAMSYTLELLKQLADGLARQFGPDCEIVIHELTHQDLGQMQMYVNYYTREMMNEGDSQPIGIVLCADKGDSIVKYTLPEDNHQIFASKYFTYLPTEEELKHELNLGDFYKLEE